MDKTQELERLCMELLAECKRKDAEIARLEQQQAEPDYETYLSRILAALLGAGDLVPSSKQPELYEATNKAYMAAVASLVPTAQKESFAGWLTAFEVIKINPLTGELYHKPGVGKLVKISRRVIEYSGGVQHGETDSVG